MTENLNVALDIRKNDSDEVEVNGYSRRALINSNFFGLSFYELVSQPRQIMDIDKVAFDYPKIDRIIKEILRCNICLQIYFEPVNIKNCLHKFCKKCIEDYNRRIKKECALCRHPIETRRLMREDSKMKEIIKCLIPSLEKFNEVEDKIITNYLPNFCFKDSAHKQQQQETVEKLEEVHSNNFTANERVRNIQSSNISGGGSNFSNTSAKNISLINSSNMEIFQNDNGNKNEFLQRKKGRTPSTNNRNYRRGRNSTHGVLEPNSASKKESEEGPGSNSASNYAQDDLQISNFSASNPEGVAGEGQNVGVKLICDSPNEEIKKYFSKTKLYTMENISLDYVSKYICFKQNYPSFHKDRICFFILDEQKNKIPLDKSFSLKQIRQTYKIKEGELIKLYFTS